MKPQINILILTIITFIFTNSIFTLISRERYEILKNDANFKVLPYEKYLSIFSQKDFEISKQTGEFFHQQELSYIQQNKNKIKISNKKDIRKEITPISFDIRQAYPACFIDTVKDQKDCGGCWAFAVTIHFSQRICFSSQGELDIILSPQYLISCDFTNKGCDGGNRIKAWDFLRKEGAVTETCLPFNSEDGLSGVCPISCFNPVIPLNKIYPNKTKEMLFLYDLDEIKDELLKNGPVTAGIQVYDDLYLYNGEDIYLPGPNALPTERHSVIIVGWGENKGKLYFIIQNSWGVSWGDKGFFSMYIDECDIMSSVFAGSVEKDTENN